MSSGTSFTHQWAGSSLKTPWALVPPTSRQTHQLWGPFPDGSDSKESACNAGSITNAGFNPWVGKIPWSPLQYSCLENLHGQRSLAGYSPWGFKELNMTEQLSTECRPLQSETPEPSSTYQWAGTSLGTSLPRPCPQVVWHQLWKPQALQQEALGPSSTYQWTNTSFRTWLQPPVGGTSLGIPWVPFLLTSRTTPALGHFGLLSQSLQDLGPCTSGLKTASGHPEAYN